MKRISFLIAFAVSLAVGDVVAEPLPRSLFFVANEGQWEEPFAFKANVGNSIYYVTSTGMTLDIRQYDSQNPPYPPREQGGSPLSPRSRGDERGVASSSAEAGFPTRSESYSVKGHVLRFTFLNANPSPEIIGEDKLSSYSNYFLGRDSCKWRSFVGHYQTVRMKNVWPGIDVVQKIQPEGVETLYRVQAGANASQINVQVEGLTTPLRVDGAGNLILSTSLGEIKEKAPFAYQIIDHRQVEVPVRFQPLTNDRYRLSFEVFDAGHELVIDPLLYGTYLGGYGPDYIYNIAIDSSGRKAVVGTTQANDFPTTPGAYQPHFSSPGDGFVTLFSPAGDSLIFSTYLAGQRGFTDLGAVAIASSGSVYAGGNTTCPEWPLTADAFDTVAGNNLGKGVLVRVSNDGARLEFSSFVGGSTQDNVRTIGVDSSGVVYLCGETNSADFPVTPDALFLNKGPTSAAFVCIFDPVPAHLSYATFIPGVDLSSPTRITLLSQGRLWLYGYSRSTDFPTTPDALQPVANSPISEGDGFFSLLDLYENRLVYSSYLGGSGSDLVTSLHAIEDNRLVITGQTSSMNFPVTQDAFDTTHVDSYKGFLATIELPNMILHSTLLGGSSDEQFVNAIYDLCLCANSYLIGGATDDPGFPTTPGAFDSLLNDDGQSSGNWDFFISRLDTQLAHLEYSTFLGGEGNDACYSVAFDRQQIVWLVGQSDYNFPVTPDAFQYENHWFGDGVMAAFSVPDSGASVGRVVKLVPENPSLTVFPNPFNPSTTISFSLPKASPVELNVYDILGRTVYRADLGRMNAGTHQRLFNLPGLTSGTYIVRLNAGPTSLSKKMIVMR